MPKALTSAHKIVHLISSQNAALDARSGTVVAVVAGACRGLDRELERAGHGHIGILHHL